MNFVKRKANRCLYRGSWKTNKALLPRSFLEELLYGDFLDHSAFVVHSLEQATDVRKYESYSRKVERSRKLASLKRVAAEKAKNTSIF